MISFTVLSSNVHFVYPLCYNVPNFGLRIFAYKAGLVQPHDLFLKGLSVRIRVFFLKLVQKESLHSAFIIKKGWMPIPAGLLLGYFISE